MVTDDPTPRQSDPPGATETDLAPRPQSLAEFIAGSPQGIDPGHVIAWADHVAADLDALHATGSSHGRVEATNIIIGADGGARLGRVSGAADDERDLLLGEPTWEPDAYRRDVRDLAAALYEALSGQRPGPDPAPIPGVTVQVNLALLAALADDSESLPGSAGQLASMLRGGPVALPTARHAPAAALGVVAAFACAGLAGGLWVWLGAGGVAPGPQAAVVQAPLPEAAPAGALAHEFRAVESRLQAQSARRRWEGVAAREPVVLTEELRDEAAEIKAQAASAAQLQEQERDAEAHRAFEHASDAFDRLLARDREARRAADLAAEGWAAALRDAPRAWAEDPAVHEAITAARVLAAQAEEACQAGRFQGAAPLYEQAALRMAEAITLNDTATAGRAPPAEHAEPPAAAAAQPVAPPQRIMVNTLSQTLVFIGPGAFRMGPAPREDADGAAGPQRSIRLSHGFFMGRVEVTRGQFAAFVGAAGYVTTAERQGWALGLDDGGRWERVPALCWRSPGFPQSDTHPVVCVSHDDAVAFCLWLGGREGRRYRLPTEAEWEYACRCGTLGAWSWGDESHPQGPLCNGADVTWTARYPQAEAFEWTDDVVFTSPVASFPANPWGLFDLHGNVLEWCQDVYAPYPVEDAADPVVAETADGAAAPRVLRGGSFASSPQQCRAAQRDAAPPATCLVTLGFRVVMDE